MPHNVLIHPQSGEACLQSDAKDTADESYLISVSHISGYTSTEYSLLQPDQTILALIEPEKFNEDTLNILQKDQSGFVTVEAKVWLV